LNQQLAGWLRGRQACSWKKATAAAQGVVVGARHISEGLPTKKQKKAISESHRMGSMVFVDVWLIVVCGCRRCVGV